SLVVLEALSAGTPIVATRVGGLPEAARDGIEALYADVGDVDGLTANTQRVLRDPDLRGRLGSAARLRYEAQFTVETFAERIGRIIATAAHPNGRVGASNAPKRMESRP